jgi:hypothetical protein
MTPPPTDPAPCADHRRKHAMNVTEEMLQAAMKEAVKQGLVPKYAISEDEYVKQWKAVEAVLRAAAALAPTP